MTLLAIDGPAGAGKTTFAAKLEAKFVLSLTVQVVHLDDLYNGWSDPLNNNLTEVLQKILNAHEEVCEISVRKFNWLNLEFDQTFKIIPTDVLILEGVGASQAVVRASGATTFWLDIEPDIGLQRVLDRDGVHLMTQMQRWQIDQAIHFNSDKTRENCLYKFTS